MSEIEELETSIAASMATIRAHWSTLLDPPSAGGASGSRSTLITADDHDASGADIDRSTRIVSLRREVVDVLNAICRWVMEERPVTTVLPDGTSALSMSLFVERHAEWIAMLDINDGEYETNRLAQLANDVRQMAAPKKREFIYLGDCPFVVEDWFCAGRVRVRIGDEEGEAACSDCGKVGTIDWWEVVLNIASEVEVTIPALVKILRDRMHITVTERTLRRWLVAGRITAAGSFVDPIGKVVMTFSPRVVLDQVARMDRECSSCGKIRSGVGDMCLECWQQQREAKPTRAERKTHRPAAVQIRPRRVVQDSHDTDRPERCHYSDLPIGQCACGRQHERMGA